MSRLYGMRFDISGYKPEKKIEIQEAINAEWETDSWFDDSEIVVNGESEKTDRVFAYGESWLCGGESEEEFSERIAKLVWEINGGYCYIEVSATYMEELPCDTYSFDEERFKDLTG